VSPAPQAPNYTPPTEAETRAEWIDAELARAGWAVAAPTQVRTSFTIRTPAQEPDTATPSLLFADYCLLGKDGQPLAVVEAKRASRAAEVASEQAKHYCYAIRDQLSRETSGAPHSAELPFCFYTNGREIWFWDLEHAPPRRVHGFPTRDDLERWATLRRNRKPLAHEFIDTQIAGRDYQLEAIRTVLEGIEGGQRDFLLVMATGTGKTRTCIALVKALMAASHVERVLFLVDRIALCEQAAAAFKEHLPNEPHWSSAGDDALPTDRRIYVATQQTMLNYVQEGLSLADSGGTNHDAQARSGTATPRQIKQPAAVSPHFFDLIVVDESHRSIYNAYGQVLSYFKTLTLGLTATPKDALDHNTFRLFHCRDGLPSFAYTYEEAVTHAPPYLCPYRVMKLQTRFQIEGISKRTIPVEEQIRLFREEGKDIEEIQFAGTDLEKQVTNTGTNELLVREFMDECIRAPDGITPGKTIFFCTSVAHAQRIREIFDKLYPQYRGELARVITSDQERATGKGGLIDQFTHNDMPRIAISVDMLDTGIDVRELVNLVFAKPVYSYTKFWQMIGRGTRLLDPQKRKPWCTAKSDFLILDCWDNFEYFGESPTGKEPSPAPLPLPVRHFARRLEKIEKAQALGHADLAARETAKLRDQLTTLPANAIDIREAAAALAQLTEGQFWQKLDAAKLRFLHREIAPLFRWVSDVDFKAMHFEHHVLGYSLARLTGDAAAQHSARKRIAAQASELPASLALVREHASLIRTLQTDAYWTPPPSENALDELVARLGPLMHLREPQANAPQVQVNFTDAVQRKEWGEFAPAQANATLKPYRQRVEARIRELLAQNPILQKIKGGQPVSEAELDALANLLRTEPPPITETDLRRAYDNRRAHLLDFLRHILGLSHLPSFDEELDDAFDRFRHTHSGLNTQQLECLKLLKAFIRDHPRVERRHLTEAPFTQFHPSGIRGVFGGTTLDEIAALAEAFSTTDTAA